jgi:hypothetical protein
MGSFPAVALIICSDAAQGFTDTKIKIVLAGNADPLPKAWSGGFQ